ncbi:MAG: SsrA-binding protein SmpB [Acidimicrobiia bacterium]|nr:SsrA-binding protein SmpB [Acidimicrobiia bacterium]
MSPPAKSGPTGVKVIATNRQARRDYEVLDTWEAGMVLMGSEVKSLREAKVQISDAYARIIGNEAWIVGLHITPYSHAGVQGAADTDRDRKLLLNRKEIDLIRARLEQERLTLVPLSLYFREGRAKLEVGLGRGRREIDKRQVIAQREADREARRAMVRGAKGTD